VIHGFITILHIDAYIQIYEMINSGKEWDWMDKGKPKSWTEQTWTCGCGALNAGWLNKCGKCQKYRK
jgi:hypothetical protein